jgi:hypothetical protein
LVRRIKCMDSSEYMSIVTKFDYLVRVQCPILSAQLVTANTKNSTHDYKKRPSSKNQQKSHHEDHHEEFGQDQTAHSGLRSVLSVLTIARTFSFSLLFRADPWFDLILARPSCAATCLGDVGYNGKWVQDWHFAEEYGQYSEPGWSCATLLGRGESSQPSSAPFDGKAVGNGPI